MKTKLKRLTTSGVALILMVSMLLSTMMTAGAIEFSGTPGGGGSQNNTGGDPNGRYKVAAVDNHYQHIVGYRFSVVTEEGRMKTDTTVKDVYLSQSSRGLACYSSALSTTWKRPKSAIRQEYGKKYTFMTAYDKDTSSSCLDRNLGNFNLPLSPTKIEAWCKADEGKQLEALLKAAGVIPKDKSLAILDSTDRILVEPIFELTLEHHLCALTVTEIAVYEYELSETGYNNKYGRTYTERYGKTFVTYEEGKTFESIVKMTNRIYPNLLYEDGRGVPSSDSLFWKGAPGEISGGIFLANGLGTFDGVSIASCIDLIEYGYGVAVVWDGTAVEETRVKLIYNVNGGTQEREFFGGYSYFASTGLVSYESVLHETIVPSNSSAKPTNWTDMGLKRDGYTLNSSLSWNTNPNGTGTVLVPGTQYDYSYLVGLADENGVVILYAQWKAEEAENPGTGDDDEDEPEKPDKIYLRYHTNGGTVSNSNLIEENGYVKQLFGSSYLFYETTVKKDGSGAPKNNYGSWGLAKEGYILNENLMWNTREDGKGKTFKPGVSRSYDEYLPYAKDGVVVLYAQWKKEGAAEQLIVKYSANGGTVEHDTTTTDENGILKNPDAYITTTVTKGQTASLSNWEKAAWTLVRDGYTLDTSEMWNGSASGKGTVFGTTATYDALYALDTDKDGVVILYAVWEKDDPESEETEPEKKYKYLYVRFHANGGTIPESVERKNRWPYRINDSGYVCGQYTSSRYEIQLKIGYTDTNGVFHSISDSDDIPLVADFGFDLSEMTFVNWTTAQNGTGMSFADGDSVWGTSLKAYADIHNHVTLYAQWYSEPSPTTPTLIRVNCFVDDVPSPFLADGTVSVSVYDGTGAVSKVINAPSTVDSIGIEGTVGFSYVISAFLPYAYSGLNSMTYYPIEEASLSSPFCVESEGLYEFNVYYYTLSYEGNPPNGKGKVTNVPSTRYLLKGIEGSVSSVSPVLSNHTFLHWTTDSTGEGTVYYPRDVITLYKPLVLYAQWINIPSDLYATLEVYTYVDNEEISITDLGLGVRVEQVVVVDGEECVIPRSLHNIAKGVYLAPLMSFGSYEWTYRVITTDENGVDWYLTADGSYTTDVTPLDPPTSSPTHYIYYYTVTYLPNPPAEGDVGNMPEKQYALKGIEEKLSTLTPTREDEYGFVNWNTQEDGSGTAYAKGAKVTLTAPLVLYAQWKTIMCELVFEAIVQGATTRQFVDDLPGAIWVETEEGSYPLGKNGTVTITLPKGTKYRLRAIYEDGGTVYPYTAKGNYEDTEFTLTKSFTHHGIYYYAINYYYGNTALETPARHYKLHGIDVKVSTDEPSIDFGTSLSRFLNVWDQPAVSMRYMPGAVYNLDQKGDLYAVTGVKVAYNVNGGTVGEGNYGVREDGLITRGGEIFFILLESEPPFTPIHYPHTFPLIPPQSNYEFVSWNEDSEGEGDVFVPGSVYGPVDFYSCDRTPDGEYAILYADWNPLINTVHFEATPEGYGTVELDGKPVSAVSGIPRGSEMYFENGQVVIEPIVNTPITVSYEDGSEESREGGKFVFKAVPADPTSQYSYKHIGWEGVAPEIDRDITVIASFDREGTGNDIAIVGNPINGNPVLDSKFVLSANIINNSDIDITPNMGIDAVVVITKNGSSEPVKTYRVENICVPKRGSNNATISSVFIKKEGSHLEYILYDNSNLVFTEASVGSVSGTGIYRFYWYLDFSHAVGFTDADSSNNESAKNAFRVKSAVSESNPSRPVYSTDIPSSFKGKKAGESAVNTFSWSYYEYNPSAPLKFVKRTGEDGFKILLVATPENEGGLKKEERVVGLPDFTTRAGYGFSLHRSYSGLEAGDLNPSASAVFASKDSFGTLCALMYYPEFDYSTEAGRFSKLLVSAPNPKGDYRVYALSLPEYPDYQTNDINDKYAHYIPMWYPDGEYKTVSKYQGVWCPLGELTATVVQGEGRVVNGLTGKVDAEDSQEEMERMRMWTNKYTIQGSMYDDIYITH